MIDYVKEIFQHDALEECLFILDPSYGQSPPVDILFNETFPDSDGRWVMFSSGFSL